MNTAYDQGLAAYYFNVAPEECPYPEGTDEQIQWINGWDDAAIVSEIRRNNTQHE